MEETPQQVDYPDGVGPVRKAAEERTVVKTYGRGSFLGLLSPLVAYVMSARGMRGWEDSSRRAMERDAVKMARRGYRVVSTEEHALPDFGIASYVVTYELTDQSRPDWPALGGPSS